MALDAQRVKAFEGQDLSALSTLEIDPELSIDQNGLQQAKDVGAPVTTYPYASVTAIVPKQTAFPAWFLAVAKNTQGDTALDLLTRQSSTTTWRLAVETRVEAGPIEWKKTSDGWAIPADLNVDPSETLSAYWSAAVSGGDAAGAGVAPGTMTSDIASGLNSAVNSNESDGWAVGLAFAPGGVLSEAVRLDGGGILGIAWVTEELKTRPQYAPCFRQPETNGSKWDPQVPNGNYEELTLTYSYLEGMAEPATGNLTALSYAEGTTGVNGTPCPG